MKTSRKAVVGASGLLLLLVVLLIRHLLDLGNQYSAFTYLRTSSANALFHGPSKAPPAIGSQVEDKVVVIAKIESEDTDWVPSELPSSVNIHTLLPLSPNYLSLTFDD